MSARIILIFSLLQSYLVAQPFYFERSDSMGVDFSALGGYGNGVSTYDWDRDGFDDLTLLRDGSLPRFYHNEGGISFSQVEFQGIDVSDNQKSVNWVDFNNDGFPDLSFNSFQGGMRLYLNQGDFTFVNITASSGVEQNAADWGYGHSWADYDRDGFLDLFVANYNIESTEIRPNHLYHNNGNNTFTDVTSVMGLGNIEEATFMGVWFDYNNDGYNDLLVLNDRVIFPNYLYKNGPFGLSDVSAAVGMNVYMDSMSGTVGDYDNDGFLDVFISNTPFTGNHFYKNTPQGIFANIASTLGVQLFQWAWGAVWVDYDSDMYQDLFVTTQPFVGFGNPGYHFLLQNQVANFSYQPQAGFLGSAGSTFGAARADFNSDGKPDLVTHSLAPLGTEVWINEHSTANYLRIAPRGVVSNRDAVGTRIEVFAGGQRQVRFTMCGEQFISQNSQWLHFGMGNSTMADSIWVRWPSGHRETFYAISSNQSLELFEGGSVTNQIQVLSGHLELCPGESVVLDGGEWDAYQWSTGSHERTITISESGSIGLQVSSGQFTIVSDPVTVVLHSLPNFATEIQHVQCFNDSDAQVEFVPDSSEALFQIFYDSLLIEPVILGLSAGEYSYELHWGSSCSLDSSFQITEPEALSILSIEHLLFAESPECMGTYTFWSQATGGSGALSYQWNFYNLGEDIPFFSVQGDSASCIPASASVIVECLVLDQNACSDQLSVQVDGVTGIQALNFKQTLFPNPTDNWVFLPEAFHVIDVVNVLGQSVRVEIGQNNALSLGKLVPGIYFVQVKNHGVDQVWRVQKK